MHEPQVDFLIIGQGLAGSILAFELIERGQSVLVIDNSHRGSSSKVAAGIINPITGHRLNLTDGFVEYSKSAHQFYQRAQLAFNQAFVSQIKQTRLIKNQGQASYFKKRLNETEYQDFLEPDNTNPSFNHVDLGCATIKQTSMVDTKLLLKLTRTWLEARNAYCESVVDYTAIKFEANSIRYNDIEASHLIFCEGYQAKFNPWLSELPFKLAKGEVLTVEVPNGPDSMLSWGNWLVPSESGTHKLGSNYDWNDTKLAPSEAVKDKLLDSLELQTSIKANVVQHEVGIRPTTTHRTAFVGALSSLENTYCFNGFGSKGCLTIPAHAELLCEHLLNKAPLPAELSKWL